MRFLAVHALLYLAASVLLVLLWLMLGGELAGTGDPLTAARESNFWPFWVVAAWGVLLALHAGLAGLWRLGARNRRRKEGRRSQERAAAPDEGRPRYIAAMFTDIVGSTALTAQLGDAAYSDVLAEHRRTVREVVADHGGSEVGTQGDGFFVSFTAPSDAVACAVALQRRLADDRDDALRVPHVRIGLHAGEVVARDGDVVGHMVNVAARVADQAAADEIVVTEFVSDHAPNGVVVDDLGLRELDGLPTPRHLLALRWQR